MNLTDLAQHLSQSGGHSLDEEGLLRFILSEELLKPLHQKIVSFSSSISPEDAQTVESVYQTCLHAGSVVGRQVHLLRLYLDKESHELVYCAVLDQFNTLTIGRGRDVGLFLNHHSVSRNHCRISRSNDSILVEDLGATNTTLVNQKKISTPVPLHANDRIDIGEIQLRIHFDIPAKKTGSDVVQENHLLSKAKSRDALSSAYPEQRTIFNTVLGNTPNKYSQRLADRKRINILLDGQPITIGRSKELSNIQLDDNMVSHRHARLRKETNGYIIEDLNSTNGIYLNGERIHREAPIHKGDLIVIGPYRLRHEGDFLTSTRKEIGAQVTINNLGKRVISREEGKPLWLLKDVSLSIHPAEFVGLMGAAGCGKSTFMDAINGRRPATNGTVLYDGQDLYQAFESVKSDIGYVPQQVILHEDLPLIDVLNYSSRLRLPSDISQDEIETNIRMALEKVGLQNREKTRIRNLSGGQKKKVTIAMELLSNPWILFFDEVTSGLDLESERQTMDLFRRLSSQDNKTVVCITHYVDSLERCDMIAHFIRGRLSFYGPPAEFKDFFKIQNIRDVYQKESDHTPEEWAEIYQTTPSYQKYVLARIAEEERDTPPSRIQPEEINLGNVSQHLGKWTSNSLSLLREGEIGEFNRQQAVLANRWAQRIRGGQYTRDFLLQLTILYRRYIDCIFADRGNLIIMLCLPPLIAALVCLLSGSIADSPQGAQDARIISQKVMCFGGLLSTFFLAMFCAIREIVKELAIYRHERFSRLLIPSYLLSKLCVLGCVGAIQSFLILFVLHFIGQMAGGNIGFEYLIFFLTSLTGISLGLMISSIVTASEWAINLMIAALLPQILFSGEVAPVNGVAKYIAEYAVACYWGLLALFSGYKTEGNIMNYNNEISAYVYFWAVGFYFFQILLFTSITSFMMARKDGPGVFERFARSILSLFGVKR